MIRFLLAILILLPQLAFGQLNDSFNDGNFSNSPKWTGDTTQFIINANFQLQSQGQAISNSIYLSTPNNKLLNTQWEFWVNMPFTSSTTNYIKLYLSSDNSDLKGSLNGYYIKIGGESGNGDGIDLFRQNGLTSTKIIDGIAGHAGKNNNKLQIKVLRYLSGAWKLYSDTTGGYDYSLEGETLDTSFTTSLYTGIVCQHTSTRRNQFYFDNYTIHQAPLWAESVNAINDSIIEIKFNNTLEATSSIQNFHIEGIGNPIRTNAFENSIQLTFPSKIPDGAYLLELKNIKDATDDSLVSQTLSFYFKAPLDYADIIITELYPDPSPSNGLPGEEFIELYNASGNIINLNGFQLHDPGTRTIIPDVSIAPNEYLILTTIEGKTEYEKWATTVVLTPWPSLNNSGDDITLKDNEGSIIFKLNYTSQWYKNNEKQDGGWTLEMINLHEHCKRSANWGSSVNPIGGSPGQVNSINSTLIDNTAPYITDSYLEDSTIIYITFNEDLNSGLPSLNSFASAGNSLVQLEQPEYNILKLQWQKAFPLNSKTIISYSKIADCLGNNTEGEIEIIRPGILDSLDIIINEILFNPNPDGVDFVEIYNRSSDILDLSNLFLQSIKDKNQITTVPVAAKSFYLHPHSYLVLCSSSETLRNNYPLAHSENIIEIRNFPSYNDDFGIAALSNASGKTIDLFAYKDSYHSVLLKETEGISLERISFELSTNYSGNWHSASSLSGLATPGYQNSMHYENTSEQTIYLEPGVITPDGDSQKDLAYINFKFKDVGNYCSIKVFNAAGIPVRELADNTPTGSEGFFIWDGADDKGKIVPSGIYILLIEYFHPSGRQGKWKQSLAVYSE